MEVTIRGLNPPNFFTRLGDGNLSMVLLLPVGCSVTAKTIVQGQEVEAGAEEIPLGVGEVTPGELQMEVTIRGPNRPNFNMRMEEGGFAMVLPAGYSVTVKNSVQGLEVPLGGGQVAVPGGGQVAVPGGGQVAVPGGGQVAVPGGGQVAVPGGGQVAVPGGGQVAVPGGGQVAVPGGGQVAVPGGGDVQNEIDYTDVIRLASANRKLSQSEVLYLLQNDNMELSNEYACQPQTGLFMYPGNWAKKRDKHKAKHLSDKLQIGNPPVTISYRWSFVEAPKNQDENLCITARRYQLGVNNQGKFLVHYLQGLQHVDDNVDIAIPVEPVIPGAAV